MTQASERQSGYRPPAGSCDCHAHVFGPEARYPYYADRSYTPADASLEMYIGLLDSLGVDRGVIVQPSVYGTDNRCTADAAAALPARLRAVAAIDPAAITDAELDRLHEQGVRGVRLSNMAKGGVSFDALEAVDALIHRLGWHIVLMLNDGALVTEMKSRLRRARSKLVFDHFALNKVAAGTDTPAFGDLLDLVREGNSWVKVSHAYGVTATGAPYADVAPLAQALVATDPTRVLWATDWPHPSHRHHPPDDRVLLDAFAGWITDETQRRLILAENPLALYDFA